MLMAFSFYLMCSERNKEDIDLPLFDLATITSATNNFSEANMIGAGGFGAVYKVINKVESNENMDHYLLYM